MKNIVIGQLRNSLRHILLLALAFGLSSCAEPSQPTRQGQAQQSSLPSGATSSQEAQQIDQQVATILAGPHGALPPAEIIHADPTAKIAEIHIKNDTGYTLTVLYSGPTSRSVVLAPHAIQRTILGTGSYGVAATVDASDVLPFAGSDDLQGGAYENTFYIETRR